MGPCKEDNILSNTFQKLSHLFQKDVSYTIITTQCNKVLSFRNEQLCRLYVVVGLPSCPVDIDLLHLEVDFRGLRKRKGPVSIS